MIKASQPNNHFIYLIPKLYGRKMIKASQPNNHLIFLIP